MASPVEEERRQNGRADSVDRRRNARYGFFHPVTLVTEAGLRLSGYSRNASLNGLFMIPMQDAGSLLVHFSDVVHAGEKALLVFPEGEQSIEFSCRVVRATKKGIALIW
ncbi:MAG: PilZ domain-containing protein [Magnetococcales bacterium]|nr:PilZ domain-containing protein [Magnetococcales bacterium]MBF0322748.1 PilZ domain-containing protein [Magnetococcales bacterium]